MQEVWVCDNMYIMKDIFTRLIEKIKNTVAMVWGKKKEKKVWIPALIVVLFGLSQLFGGSASADVRTYRVVPKDFVQKVSLTGKVIAAKNVDMGFEVAGRVDSVKVKVGDIVKKGTVLASLSNADYTASLQKNIAIRTSEEAKLNDIIYGTKKEDIRAAEDAATSAEADLHVAEQSLLDQIRDTYAKADEAIRFNIDNAFTDPRGSNPTFKYLIDQNPKLKDTLTDERLRVGDILKNLNNITSIDQLKTIRSQIGEMQKFINDVNFAISIVSETNSGQEAGYTTTLNDQKASIAAARTLFSAAIASLNQAEASYKASVNALTSAKNALALVVSDATPQQVAIYKANIASAQASVGSSAALLSRTRIVAPFDGVITKVDIKEGEISSPNTPVISMLNDGEYQIETFVSENDIGKLKINQTVKVTLDAYGRDLFFDALVISVDPAETVKDGVSTYRTKIQFVGKDEKVKSGMTANIEIETDRRLGVLQIPQVGLMLDAGVKKVTILKDIRCVGSSADATTNSDAVLSPNCTEVLENKDDTTVVVSVQTGEISSTGDIEVVGGITEGQTIIYSVKSK